MPVRNYDAVVKHMHRKDMGALLEYPNIVYVLKDIQDAFKNDEKVTVTIKTRRKPRSLSANNYLHLCLQIIADETGNSLDNVKSTLKLMYAKKPLLNKDEEPIIDEKTGEQAFYVQDTSDMDSFEFGQFVENVKMFAIDFCGFSLPEPDENLSLKFK